MGDEPIVIGGETAAAPRRGTERGRRRGWWAVPAVTLVAVVVAAVFADTGTAPGTPALVPPSEPDAGLLPPDFVGEVLAVTTDGSVTRLAVLGKAGWDEGSELPPLDWARFDASGGFLAGTAGSGAGLRDLWAGSPGGELERVATGVRAFAWHDADAARLAWTELTPQGRLMLTTGEMGAGRGTPVAAFDIGELRRWGDWGFAVLLPGRPLRTLLVDPDGLAVDELDGYPVGEVAPGIPGFTADGRARRGEPEGTYGYEDGRMPVWWVPEGEYVRAIEPRGNGTMTAVVASESGLSEAGRTLLVDSTGQVQPWDAPATGPAPLAWDLPGRHALTASTGPGGQATIDILDTASGERTSVPAGPRVILDLAVRRSGR